MSGHADVVESFRSCKKPAMHCFDLPCTSSTSDSSESEGICADYLSKNSTSMTSSTFEDEITTRRLNDSLYRNAAQMDRSVDFSDTSPAYRGFSAPRSRMGLSSVHEITPKSTKIPILMSRSLSTSSEQDPFLRRNTFCSPIAVGSGDQLCGESSNSKEEVKLLLQRCRTRQPIRVAGYESRCLLPPTLPMSSSLPPLQRSTSRPRLLQRPQMLRRGEQPLLGVRPLDSRSQSRDRSNHVSASSDISPKAKTSEKSWRRQRNKLGGFSLDIRRIVSLYRSTFSRCRTCRHTNSLRRLVTKWNPRFLPCGIAKPNVVRRSLCVCGRDIRLSITTTSENVSFIEPNVAQHIMRLFDWAALFALISLLLSAILRLLAL
ncbi:hypothetical protein RB195_002855 [Necator americanus]|uniref:Uncharacterized protein n=1 Tax=Necator americanus TaxID=51031 RepID=A0ABR1DL68_NECAM